MAKIMMVLMAALRQRVSTQQHMASCSLVVLDLRDLEMIALRSPVGEAVRHFLECPVEQGLVVHGIAGGLVADPKVERRVLVRRELPRSRSSAIDMGEGASEERASASIP